MTHETFNEAVSRAGLMEAGLRKIRAIFKAAIEAKNPHPNPTQGEEAGRESPEYPAMLVDAKGRHCPVSIISPIDLARDKLVNDLAACALQLSQQIEAFKQATFADVNAFVAVSNGEHGGSIGVVPEGSGRKAWKGNLQLINYQGTCKICIKVSDNIAFTEKLTCAMEKLKGLIEARSGDVDEIIQALVSEAFNVDKAGYIDPQKVLALRRHKVSHPVWKSAMEDISESIQIVGSKSYLQFWQRETPEAEWQSIALDIARL